jgi:hypothetical protein
MSNVPDEIVSSLCVGPLSEIKQRICKTVEPYERALECLQEFRKMLDEGYVLVPQKSPFDVTRIIKLIAKTDSVLIPLRSQK